MSYNTLKKSHKPWGYEILFAHTDKYAGKILSVTKGQRLSLQFHKQKDETMFILRGCGKMTIGMISFPYSCNQTFRIDPKTKHRIEAMENTLIIEVSTPELEDVVRLEDDYGRILNRKRTEASHSYPLPTEASAT